MRKDYEGLEIDMLQRLYEARQKEMEDAVLSGTSWEAVSIQRRILAELSQVLHDKLQRSREGSRFDI